MADDNNSLMKVLVAPADSLEKGRVDFATAMQKMGFTSVFDIIRLPKPAFARQLARFSDADAGLAYENAKAYATLIGRLYREHQTSSGTPQQLAQRSGVRALVPVGPTFCRLFEETWDEYCKFDAIAAYHSPPAYLSAMRVFIRQLEEIGDDTARILLDKRRPDLNDLLITQESTFTPIPMLKIVNQVLDSNLRVYLDRNPVDKPKTTQEVLTERRYPFELPYNFYYHQCHLGLADKKPRLGELNYRASLLLPIDQSATNAYGAVQEPVRQAQQLLSGFSPQQLALLIEPSLFSNFFLTRIDLNKGWRSAGSTYLGPHTSMSECFTLPTGQAGVGSADPQADVPVSPAEGTNTVAVTFEKEGAPAIAEVALLLGSTSPTSTNDISLLNSMYVPSVNTITSYVKAKETLSEPEQSGYTAHFNLVATTGTNEAPISLALQSFTLTLDDEYSLNAAQIAFFKQSYGIDVTHSSPLWHLTLLTDFMAHTGLNAEQVERLLCRRTCAVRLSPNCPSQNPQHTGVTLPGSAGKVLPFPHPNHYGACYVNGTGTGADLYDSQLPPTDESIIRDQFDNAMDLEQYTQGKDKHWRLTKTSLNRLDRLQRMIRLQRWSGIPFAHLDTLIISAIRAEGGANLGMEFSENTLRALGVYCYMNQRHGIQPEEFAALMHDLCPYASGKDEVPLFDQVFNRVQLFDKPLILDHEPIKLDATDADTQKTLLQLCAGLGVQPTEDSLLLIAAQTENHLKVLKRDLPTVSSLYRQARIARLFDYSVAELLTLAGLLGGRAFKTALASGRLSSQEGEPAPDILDVLMQLDWAVDWLKDSQQTVAQLQQRLGPNVPLVAEAPDDHPQIKVAEPAPLPDDLLARLATLQADTSQHLVTEKQVAALGLPLTEDAPSSDAIKWFELLINHEVLDKDGHGLLRVLDRPLTLVDEPATWLQGDVDALLKDLKLSPAVKELCAAKLVELLLGAHEGQTQLLERMFQETAQLPPERCIAVIHWAHASVYSILLATLADEVTPELIEHFQRVARHAEVVVQLRLSNSTLRQFLVNPQMLGGDWYDGSSSEPSLSDLFLLERFSHWFHNQSESEDSLLSYFSLASPPARKLKNKALRKAVSESANSALARLLEWSEAEVTALTENLSEKRACSMAEVEWVRRCQATCRASGLSATALMGATALTRQSGLVAWKTLGDAVMAAHSPTN
jgi:hypothetical protein